MTIDEALKEATVSVPEAGSIFFGLGRNASYAAATRGDIPTVMIGGKLRALVRPIAAQLGYAPNA